MKRSSRVLLGTGKDEEILAVISAVHIVFQRRPWRSCLVMPHNAKSVLFRILSHPGTLLHVRVYLFMICNLMGNYMCTHARTRLALLVTP